MGEQSQKKSIEDRVFYQGPHRGLYKPNTFTQYIETNTEFDLLIQDEGPGQLHWGVEDDLIDYHHMRMYQDGESGTLLLYYSNIPRGGSHEDIRAVVLLRGSDADLNRLLAALSQDNTRFNEQWQQCMSQGDEINQRIEELRNGIIK
tara:strand:+ start:697 stop:1137 length:441 start_codon:yes stop_codon:yes gene_type:complete